MLLLNYRFKYSFSDMLHLLYLNREDVWTMLRRHIHFDEQRCYHQLPTMRNIHYKPYENLFRKTSFHKYTSVKSAIKFGYSDILEKSNLLKKAPVDINILRLSVQYGNLQTFQWVVSKLDNTNDIKTIYCSMSATAAEFGKLDILQFIDAYDTECCDYRECMRIAVVKHQMNIIKWINSISDLPLKDEHLSKYLHSSLCRDENKKLKMFKYIWKSARYALDFEVACFLTTGTEGLNYFIQHDMFAFVNKNYPKNRDEFLKKIVDETTKYIPINPLFIEMYKEKCNIPTERFVPYFIRAIKEADEKTVTSLWRLCMSEYYQNPRRLDQLRQTLSGSRISSIFPIPWLQNMSETIHVIIRSVCCSCSPFSLSAMIYPQQNYHEASARLKKLKKESPQNKTQLNINVLLGKLRDPFRTLEYIYQFYRLNIVCASEMIPQGSIMQYMNEKTIHIFRFMYHNTILRNIHYSHKVIQYLNLIIQYLQFRCEKLYNCIKWIHYNMLLNRMELAPSNFILCETKVESRDKKKRVIISKLEAILSNQLFNDSRKEILRKFKSLDNAYFC